MKASNPNPSPNPNPNQVPCVLMRACVARPAGGGVGAISKAWTGARSILTSKQGTSLRSVTVAGLLKLVTVAGSWALLP